MLPYLNIKALSLLSRLVLYLLPLTLLFASSPMLAQQNSTEPGKKFEDILPLGFMDSVRADSAGLIAIRAKSPGGALLRAMALPGWGQFYTGHPVRGTLAAVLETAFFSMAIVKYRDRNSLSDELHRLEKERGDSWPPEDPGRLELNERVKNLTRKGGDYLAYGITTLMLSMIDSYVSAHLYRFDSNVQVSLGNPVTFSMRF